MQKLLPQSRQLPDSFENSRGTVVAWPGRGKADVVRLTERRRAVLAEKFGDLANLAVAALVFGQAIGESVFSLRVAAAGIAIWSVFTAATFLLAGESR